MELLRTEYESIWRNLTANLGSFRERLQRTIDDNSDQNLHDLIKEIYHYPKSVMSEYLKELLRNSPDNTPNPGAISGFFFEELIAAFFEVKKPEGVTLYRNFMPVNKTTAKFRDKLGIRDPDIYLQKGDSHFLVETKFVAHTNFVESFQKLQKSEIPNFHDIKIKYCMVVGWSSIKHDLLRKLIHEDWMCIFDGTPTTLEILEDAQAFKFDQLLDDMVSFFK